MKVGIYKPFKKVFFHDDKEDNAAWSYEVVHVAKILAERGDEVYMLSETDLKDGVFERIHPGSAEEVGMKYDRIIIWSGSFQLDKYKDEIIPMLAARTPRLDFMLTDLRLVPENKELYRLFNNIYTQATDIIPGIPTDKQWYGGVAEFLPYKHEYKRSVEEAMEAKDTEFYFGGTERGRLMDFIEYVWRPGHVITTKTAFFRLENRCGRDDYMKLLEGTRFSIVIADVLYNENHFITPRPFEYYMHDIVCFVDNKYDPDFHLIPEDSWLRVHNYKELREKMNELIVNPALHRQWLLWGREQITPALTSGDYVYEQIQQTL
jgi:hypothetical protein